MPPEARSSFEEHPGTLDPNARISKRAFVGQISEWRRRLHKFEKEDQEEEKERSI